MVGFLVGLRAGVFVQRAVFERRCGGINTNFVFHTIHRPAVLLIEEDLEHKVRWLRATQFALLSAFAAVGRTWLATPGGYIAEGLGWVGFWIVTVVIAAPGMLLLWMLWRKGFVVQTVRQPSTEDDGHELAHRDEDRPAPART